MIKLRTINEDERGSISLIEGNLYDLKEITLFTTNKNFARGGCIHRQSKETLNVVFGTILYIYGKQSDEVILTEGESFIIPPNTPHYFVSLTNSVVTEFGPSPEEKQEKYELFRQRVLEINARNKKSL